MVFVLVVCIAWVFSVCVHEFAHAAVAYCGGDHTVARKGYLTLNPLKYTDPIYSLAMPMALLLLGGIGLPGGAVYIEDHRLSSRAWRTAVSLAGPAASAVLMLGLALPFLLGAFPPGDDSPQARCVAFLVGLQASALLLNLLPIPPLDGFQAIQPYLPFRLRSQALRHANAVFLVFLAILWFSDTALETFWGIVWKITSALNISPSLVYRGLEQFRFWAPHR